MENRRNQFEAPSQAHYSSLAAGPALDTGHGAFASLALSYWSRGFSPIPILAGTKAPGVNGRLLEGWARYCAEAADKGQLAAWAEDKRAGLAVCTGFDGLVAVDVDSAKAVAAVRAVFGGIGGASQDRPPWLHRAIPRSKRLGPQLRLPRRAGHRFPWKAPPGNARANPCCRA